MKQELINRLGIEIRAELGRAHRTMDDLKNFREGSILPLEKLAGEPIDVYANGLLVAKGEVVIIDQNFGVRLTDLVRR